MRGAPAYPSTFTGKIGSPTLRLSAMSGPKGHLGFELAPVMHRRSECRDLAQIENLPLYDLA
jgi:hypothetical protein